MRQGLLMVCLFCPYLIAQQPDSGLLQRYSQEGARALAEKRYADAERAYEKLRELDPHVAEVYANLGLTYFQQGKFTEAIPVLRQALKLKPGLHNAQTFLVISLSELGQFEEALPGLETGFQRTSDSGLKRLIGLHLERAYTGLRRDREAAEIALDLARLYPDDAEVLYHAGRLCGNFAYIAMQRLGDVAPDSVWRHRASGELFETQGHAELAVREYRRVLALDPDRPGNHYRLGRALLLRSREVDSQEAASVRLEASGEFEQELRVDPANANAAYELGEIQRKAGQLDKAQELFEIALKYDSDFGEGQLGLARVLIARGKPDQALPHLRKAISLNPENEVSYYQLSLAHQVLGNASEQQKAMAEFQRVRNQNASREERLAATSSPRDVTKQEIDSDAAQ